MTERPLEDLLDALRREDLLVAAPADSPPLLGISADSRTVETGGAYIAVRGSQSDGHAFVGDAIRRGACVVVVEEAQAVDVPQVLVRDGRRAAIVAGRFWFGNPGRGLRLVGVTGTNGKTTTTALVRHLLNREGTAGSIGTLGAFDGMGTAVPSTAGSLTTPGPIDLQATLRALSDRRVRWVAMETSSHSLDQGRLDGLGFAAGIFTNLTRDHLDYHRTMEEYLAAKLRLATLLEPDGVAVVNGDDPAWAAVPASTRRISFGTTPGADVRGSELQLGNSGTGFRLDTPQGTVVIQLPLLGEFNVSNALGAAAAALALGVPLRWVQDRLCDAPQVPGRMERIARTPCVVLRDYAHTPDALERALRALRPLTRGRLLVLFGCGGERDRGKRPIMGRLAVELADLAIATSDNPRTEDPERILDEVESGMGGRPHWRLTDRRDAISRALAEAGADDTLLLAGKGHEDYQVIGTEKLPFDERKIVLTEGGAE